MSQQNETRKGRGPHPTNRRQFVAWLIIQMQADGVPIPQRQLSYLELQEAVARWRSGFKAAA